MKSIGTAGDGLNLETAVGSQKSAQALGAPDKIQKCLITTEVTTTFCLSPCTPIAYTAFLCPTAVSRQKNGTNQSRLGAVEYFTPLATTRPTGERHQQLEGMFKKVRPARPQPF